MLGYVPVQFISRLIYFCVGLLEYFASRSYSDLGTVGRASSSAFTVRLNVSVALS